jgi:hypothetical protein
LLESILKSGLLSSGLLAGKNCVNIVRVGIAGVGIIAPTQIMFLIINQNFNFKKMHLRLYKKTRAENTKQFRKILRVQCTSIFMFFNDYRTPR